MKNLIKRHVAVTALTLIILMPGCYTYRVQAPQISGVADDGEMLWSFVWGLAQERPPVECHGQPLAEVTIRSNLLYDIVTVATLGFASPKKAEWKCAAPNPPPGRIPVPGDSTRRN